MGKKLWFFAAVLLGAACSSSSDDIEAYNRKQAEQIAASKPQGPPAVKVEIAVPGGVKIACDKLLDAAKLTELLGEKEPVTISDQSKAEFEVTSLCSVRRGGKVMSAKKQEELLKKTARLGVLAGDEICSIAAFCSIPADVSLLKSHCDKDGTRGNEDIGVFACVTVTPKGPDDSFTYKLVDPDARCVLRVRGGPSVNEEAMVQTCAKAALAVIGPDSVVVE